MKKQQPQPEMLDMHYFIELEKNKENYGYKPRRINGKTVITKPNAIGSIMQCSIPKMR